MSLESVPEILKNTSNEHCFESCLGMTLAHYEKLGQLGLQDIVQSLSQPGEESVPMSRTIEWLDSYGLQVEYIEQENEFNTEFFSTLRRAGATTLSIPPTTRMAIRHVNEGKALITQVNYVEDSGQEDYDLNHAVFLAEYDDDGVLILDPDGMEVGTSSLEAYWGRYPNLISVSLK